MEMENEWRIAVRPLFFINNVFTDDSYRFFILFRMTRLRLVVILSEAKYLYESLNSNIGFYYYGIVGTAMRRQPKHVLLNNIPLAFNTTNARGCFHAGEDQIRDSNYT